MAQVTKSLCEEVILTNAGCGLTANEQVQMAALALQALAAAPSAPEDRRQRNGFRNPERRTMQQDALRYRELKANWDHYTGLTWKDPAAFLDAYVDERMAAPSAPERRKGEQRKEQRPIAYWPVYRQIGNTSNMDSRKSDRRKPNAAPVTGQPEQVMDSASPVAAPSGAGETPRTDAWLRSNNVAPSAEHLLNRHIAFADFARELEREVQELGERVQVMERERLARNAIDPVTRLHNLCDHLAEHRRDSPYDEASWDLIEQENKALRDRAERAEASLKEAREALEDSAEAWQDLSYSEGEPDATWLCGFAKQCEEQARAALAAIDKLHKT
jgi:hypothetical protein